MNCLVQASTQWYNFEVILCKMNELFYTVNCFEKICCMLNSKSKTAFCIFENKLNYAYWRLIYKPNSPIMSWFPIFIIYKSNKNIEAITATNSFFFSFDWLPEKKKNICIAKGDKNLEIFIRKKLKNRISFLKGLIIIIHW